MKRQKDPNSQHNVDREERRTDAAQVQDLLQSYINHGSVALTKENTNKTMQ